MKKRTQSIAAHTERVIPLAQEEIKVRKQSHVTGITRVRKTVHEVPMVADEPLEAEEVVVERIPVNKFIDRPRTVRDEAGTTIIPVMEEVLVVEKKLLLREEVRVTKQSKTVHRPQTVLLKREEATVEQRKQKHQAEKSEDERQPAASKAAEKGGKP